MNNISQIFKDEAFDLLNNLEALLLDLEKQPTNIQLVDQVFRTFHTMKGSGGMFGFTEVVSIVHEVETVFDRLRAGKIKVTPELIRITLDVRDQIRLLIFSEENGKSPDPEKIGKLVMAFRRILPIKSIQTEDQIIPPPTASEEVQAGPSSTTGEGSWSLQDCEVQAELKPEPVVKEEKEAFTISFTPKPGFFQTGTDPVDLIKRLQKLGTCAISCHMEDIPNLDDFDPENTPLSWEITLETELGINAIRDIFILFEDVIALEIKSLATENSSGETLNSSVGPAHQIPGKSILKGASIEDEKPVEQVEKRTTLQEIPREEEKANSAFDESGDNIHIGSEKLDRLVNLIGELVTVQARLNQLSTMKKETEFMSLSEELGRLTDELRDSALNIRMLPVSTLFNQFQDFVRGIAEASGKRLKLIRKGAENELDKIILEKLFRPFSCLLKNAVEHGLETPAERVKAGKSPECTIRLSARHSGGNFIVQIADDGKGMNLDEIAKHAVERGFLRENESLTCRNLLNLICRPGFTHRGGEMAIKRRTSGLSIAKKTVEELRGTLEVRTVPGGGTEFTIQLPLTLSIIEGLLVAIGDRLFVMPLFVVEECMELTRQDEKKAFEKNVVMIRGRIVPYIRLREKFGIEGNPPAIQQIVITRIDQQRIGFVVDKVIGEYQTVIKPLGKMYKNVTGISGATIMGDGTVALILDPLKISQEETSLQLIDFRKEESNGV